MANNAPCYFASYCEWSVMVWRPLTLVQATHATMQMRLTQLVATATQLVIAMRAWILTICTASSSRSSYHHSVPSTLHHSNLSNYTTTRPVQRSPDTHYKSNSMIIPTQTPAEKPFSLEHAILQARALGFASTSNITCAAPQRGLVGEPIAGSLTFHHMMILISSATLGITILSTIYASWAHLHRYTIPQEQRQILRIINLPAAYSIFNFLGLLFYNDYFYIVPICDLYEAFTVAALFLLMLEFVCPDGTDRETFFNALPAVDKKGNPVGGGSLPWFKVSFRSVRGLFLDIS